MKRWRWLRIVQVAVPVVTIAAALAVQLGHATGSMPPRLAMLLSKHYVASPFFSLSAFRSVKEGMTEEEVRDRLGYPLQRVVQSGNANVLWIYTKPYGSRKGWYSYCLVVFDMDTRHVSKVRERSATYSPALVPPWSEYLCKEVGAIHLRQSDGSELQLTPADPPRVLLLEPGIPLFQDGKLHPTKEGRMRAGLAAAGLAWMETATLRVDDALAHAGKYVPPCEPLAADTYTVSQPVFGPLNEPLCMVYCRGTLYALPAVDLCAPPDEWAPDLRWLVERLQGLE